MNELINLRNICLICYNGTIMYRPYQCLGLVLWSTEVLTEGLPLLFCIPFSIFIFLALLFLLCGHFLLINTWMDGTVRDTDMGDIRTP